MPDIDDPRNGTSFGQGARPARLITDVFERIRVLPGWFNVDVRTFTSSCPFRHRPAWLATLVGAPRARRACWRTPSGRVASRRATSSTSRPSRTGTGRPRAGRTSVGRLIRPEQVRIVRGYSRDLTFEPKQAFRFAHIDGGHSYDTVAGDLRLVAAHVVPHGVIAVDDYENRMFPAVTRAVDDFLGACPDYSVLET